MSAPYAELEHPLEDVALLCRGCLAESGEMKDMVEWGLTDDFCRFTDVQVDTSDGLSQLLCISCEDALVKCKEFRKQCWTSDMLIRSIAKRKKEERISTPAKPSVEDDSQNTTTEVEVPLETRVSGVLYDSQLVIMISATDSDSKIFLSCPHNNCTHKFMKKKDLLCHLSKMHYVNIKNFTIDLQYYCCYQKCAYHVNSQSKKWFSGRKYLNQHYNKVHKSKTFSCDICGLKFATGSDFKRHLKTCNMTFPCNECNNIYDTNEKLLVHLMRRHPELHKQYKDEKKANKRKAIVETETKKPKVEDKLDYICDSPKRSFATQTLKPEENIKNDVTLLPWFPQKSDYKTDEISTQTVFEDLLSLKSQNSEDESLFFSETVSLSDIQTQTFPVEFGLSRSNKETLTNETQSPDLSIKETQTCFCLYDSPKVSYKLFDSVSSSPASINLTSTQTQTMNKGDVLIGSNTIETQTCFDDETSKDDI